MAQWPQEVLLMMRQVNAAWLAALVAAVAVLQALDSGILGAGVAAQMLVVVAIAAPVVALALRASYGIQALSLLVMAGLLTWARIIAPVPLNALHIMMVPPALLILTLSRREGATAK
jgi:hypothetical protein